MPRQKGTKFPEINDLKKALSEETKNVALAVGQALVRWTPIDTGRAKSNWRVRVGKPHVNKIRPLVPGHFGSTTGETIEAASAKMEERLANYRGEQDIYITNNLDYIKALNEGSSSQAPAGFVEFVLMVYGKNVTTKKGG